MDIFNKQPNTVNVCTKDNIDKFFNLRVAFGDSLTNTEVFVGDTKLEGCQQVNVTIDADTSLDEFAVVTLKVLTLLKNITRS